MAAHMHMLPNGDVNIKEIRKFNNLRKNVTEKFEGAFTG